MTRPLYLRSDVNLEPLVRGWCAWLHLLAPVQAALNLRNVHLGVLDSYCDAPDTHARAAADPALRGGPFVDLGANRVAEVAVLRAAMAADPAIELAAAWIELQGVVDGCTGFAVGDASRAVPDGLRGLVELVYDIRHRPSARLIEGLLYRSPHYDERQQSIELSRARGDARPFILSTPRLPTPGHIHIPLPLSSPAIDMLAAARIDPADPGDLAEALGVVDHEGRAVLTSLLDDAADLAPDRAWDSDGVRVRYFGHACVLVQHRGASLLVDPLVATNPHGEPARYSLRDLPDRIDTVLITHGHQDHFVLETLLQLRPRIGTIVVPAAGGGALEDPSPALALRAVGFRHVIEVSDFDELDVPGMTVVACPFVGEHADLAIAAKSTYLVDAGGTRILFAADSTSADPRFFANVQAAVGKADAVFLGMECDGAPLTWLYGALFGGPVDRALSRSRTLSGSNATAATHLVRALGASRAFVYAMGREPWLQHITATNYRPGCVQLEESAAFRMACAADGVAATELLGRAELVFPG